MLNREPLEALPQNPFNLSILECKSETSRTNVVSKNPFNLSILECKYMLWADKTSRLPAFNLSILECKFCALNCACS